MNEPRVIVRHAGPAGPTGPAGPAGSGVSGPVSSTANNIATFTDASGRAVKDSGIPVASLATTAALANKVDKIAGKGLSDSNFTVAEKSKLAYLAGAYRGTFDTMITLNAFDFSPAPAAGDFCLLEVAAEDVVLVIWDNTNEVWTEFTLDPVTMTAEEIATALFNTSDAASYSKELCRIFTQGDKANLDLMVSTVLNAVAPAYGSVHYFDIVSGTAVVIASLSDGSTNMVKAAPATTLNASVSSFDTGASPTNGRLRYTGAVARVFNVTAQVTAGSAGGDALVFGIFKNGVLVSSSRSVNTQGGIGQPTVTSLSCLVELTTNDYVEVFVGNTTDTSSLTVFSLSLNARSV